MDSLSVKEHLIFMTEMKLGNYKKPHNNVILNTLIRDLKLKSHLNTPIKGLSGGERRLLSLASSLLSNPQILICDEPTTGLDSYNALLVIGVLKKLSLTGKVVICSVHQPSWDLFKEFSSILLMAEGKLLFHGTHEQCRRLFESANFQMASSLVIGTCYMGISGNTQRGIQDIRGFLWLMTSEVCFGLSYNALYAFDAEITLFKREAGMYSCSAYFVNRLLNYIPRCIVWPITLVFIATLAVELPNHVVTALEFTAALIGAGFASVAYGLGMSAVFISSGVMGDVMPCADLPLFLMSGAFLRITSIPLWLYPLKYISHFYYAMDAISNLYWRQIYYIDCPSNSTTLCIKDGPSVLLENGYSANFIFEDCLGLMFITILWSLLAYWGLKREEKKGYAY
ncbi:hypothetical protein O3G_MSEX015123 [Manduca sexta]|nr:hypothetical protein O3G_MSEX015123 [Manduca sexta]KAG6465393.1 hypothetical protein O3G_MSEX015123 [Manduca sexta]KAG6465394.1 hypothetical protein O3G_MSEX015123 [Manduca sexta]KAG6465395.1 hypothetical protein O3G_MSEX015123 [Manduca sexta]